jgi:hypothetical protein
MELRIEGAGLELVAFLVSSPRTDGVPGAFRADLAICAAGTTAAPRASMCAPAAALRTAIAIA